MKKFKTNYNSAIDAISKYIDFTGVRIDISFTYNDMEIFDMFAKIWNDIYIIEHKYRENKDTNTYEKFVGKYPEGVMLEREKYDNIMNYISFRPHIKGMLYITSLPDGTHFIYEMNTLELPEPVKEYCNIHTHIKDGKKLKYVYYLDYLQGITLK